MSLTRVLTRPHVGMGEYPGFYCYDAGRPSWMPYWWDSNAESWCKFKAVPGNISACLNPLSNECASTKKTGSWVNVREDLGLPVPEVNPDPDLSGPGIAETGAETNAPPENQWAGLFWPLMILGGIAVAGFVLSKR